MIIGVLNQKGGAGKTTLAVNIAATLALGGMRVLLVDADPQGSSLAWSAAREAPPLFSGCRDGEAHPPPRDARSGEGLRRCSDRRRTARE